MFSEKVDHGHFVKVGIAKNPKNRVKQMQTGCPIHIGYCCFFTLDSVHLARKVERLFHQVLKFRKRKGEWFFIVCDDLPWFSDVLNRYLETLNTNFHTFTIKNHVRSQ